MHRPVPRLRGQVEYRHVHLSYTGKEVVLPDFSLDHRARRDAWPWWGTPVRARPASRACWGASTSFRAGRSWWMARISAPSTWRSTAANSALCPRCPSSSRDGAATTSATASRRRRDAEVEAVARQVAGGDWLNDLPDGLRTDVGERGARLSMGQRQLVALARVLLQDPAIFILDEATASVDPFTEVQIQEGLEVVMHHRTSMVIAHRLSTVRHAHRILVMRDGQIIEEGNHEALMAQGGHYAELYNTYFRHQSLEYIENARRLVEL